MQLNVSETWLVHTTGFSFNDTFKKVLRSHVQLAAIFCRSELNEAAFTRRQTRQHRSTSKFLALSQKEKQNNNSKWWVNTFNGIVWILSWIIHTSYSILTKKKDLIRLSYYQTKGFTRSNILMNVKHLNIWIHHSS